MQAHEAREVCYTKWHKVTQNDTEVTQNDTRSDPKVMQK